MFSSSSMFRRLTSRQLAVLGLLFALELVIGRLTFGPANLKFGVTFIIVGLMAKYYGPYWTMLVAFVHDFVSTLWSGYGYFWGFALSALVAATIYGFSFYGQKAVSWPRTLLTVALVLFLVNTIMNTLWLIIMGHITDPHAILSLIGMRSIKEVIFLPIQTVLLHLVLNNQGLNHLFKRIFP